jgi:hypothetical protein
VPSFLSQQGNTKMRAEQTCPKCGRLNRVIGLVAPNRHHCLFPEPWPQVKCVQCGNVFAAADDPPVPSSPPEEADNGTDVQ